MQHAVGAVCVSHSCSTQATFWPAHPWPGGSHPTPCLGSGTCVSGRATRMACLTRNVCPMATMPDGLDPNPPASGLTSTPLLHVARGVRTGQNRLSVRDRANSHHTARRGEPARTAPKSRPSCAKLHAAHHSRRPWYVTLSNGRARAHAALAIGCSAGTTPHCNITGCGLDGPSPVPLGL